MKRVLFVCVGNSARSQMAEGLTKALADFPLEVASAGTNPAAQVDPIAVEVMREIGIDISGHQPKSIAPEDMLRYDYVITMGCGAEGACPAAFGGTVADWGLPDPTDADLEQYRQIRDTIREHVRELLREVKEDDSSG